MLHEPDDMLSRGLAAARPIVPAGFADEVLRHAAAATPIAVPEPRRVPRRALAAGALVAAVAAAAVVAGTRPHPGAPATLETVERAPAAEPPAPAANFSPLETPAAPAPAAGVACPQPAQESTDCGCDSAKASEPAAGEVAAPVGRVTVAEDGSPSVGPAEARVVVIELIDFECAFCERALSTVHELAALYPRDVRVVTKNFPMDGHAHARLAAEAALAAGDQGKYVEMRDVLLANQEDLSREALDAYARTLGLDMERFGRALEEHRFAAQVDRDAGQAIAAGIKGVPAFVINGRVVLGFRPLEDLRWVVDEELSR